MQSENRSPPFFQKKSPRKPRKFEGDLPAPPPDPRPSSSRRNAPPKFPEDAFEHLSKLYSLVEQIVELRNRSSRQFNRVRQLERVRALRRANGELEKALSTGQDVPLPDEDVGFAESLLQAMLASGFEVPRRSSNVSRASSSAKRTGSLSVGAGIEQRRVSCPMAGEPRAPVRSRPTALSQKKRPAVALPKVSKWTRVKAAFKWEKASCNPGEAPESHEGQIKLLHVPDTQAGSSEISGPPTPVGTISSSSSVDDVFHRSHRTCSSQSRGGRQREGVDINDSDPSRRSRSLDGETLVPVTFNYGQRGKDAMGAVKIDRGIAKSPWGKMKDIMQLRRDSLGRQTSRNSRNEDNHSTSSLDSTDVHKSEDGRVPRVRITSEPSSSSVHSPKIRPMQPERDLASRRLTPTLTITVPSSEELRNISSPESITPPTRRSSDCGRSEKSPGCDSHREKAGQTSPGSSSGILRYGLGRSKTTQAIPESKRHSKGDSLGSSPKMQRRNSKWNKVKRAFLTSATSVPTSPSRISAYFFDDEATAASYSASASAEDLDDASSNPAVQAEIQRNYRLLHDKLGAEFYRKLAEWERLKSTSFSPNVKVSLRLAREKDAENLRLLSEDKLTPEFKKKLEEWKRMSKSRNSGESRGLNKRRLTDWQLWRSPSKTEKPEFPGKLSDEFVKKMEGWNRMKAARKEAEAESRKLETGEENEEDLRNEMVKRTKFSERFKSWKGLEDEEFKSLGKIISTMERDQQTRLSKLHRVVGSAPEKTQEVLIHTSTGLYRFEGISRQFTMKLYEWEKSQGIAPECSTFRLLDPLRYGISSRPRLIPRDVAAERKPPRSFTRSKSIGSLHPGAFTQSKAPRPPSSLSLNDIDTLETRCISVPTIADEEDTSEDIALDYELDPLEPEAMIIDIEDVVEETASPMAKYQPHQTPVYSVAGSETTSIAIPLGTVTSSHEPSPVILIQADEAHPITAQACVVEEAGEDGAGMIRISEVTSIGDGEECAVVDRWVGKREKTSVTAWTNGRFPYADFRKMAARADESTTEVPCGRSRTEPEDASAEVVITVARTARHSRKYLKTRRLTDTHVGYELRRSLNDTDITKAQPPRQESPEHSDDFLEGVDREKIIINEDTLNKIVVPTSSGTISMVDEVSVTLKLTNQDSDIETKKEKRDPASMFVKTKRIVFSPFKRDSKPKSAKSSPSNTPETESAPDTPVIEVLEPKKFDVPPSPIPARKEYKTASPKETAPSIRLMIKKYNEKLEAPGSATSSGSGSPIWRSPVSERRIRTRMEKYQEEVRKAIAGPMYRPGISGISKSSTIDFAKTPRADEPRTALNSVVRSETAPQIPQSGFARLKDHKGSSTSLRALMIQKAKEEFLSRGEQSSPVEDERALRVQENFNEVQTVSRADLVKSASVGMINIDPDAFERLQTADSLTITRNCDSLPRSSDHLRQQVEKCSKESRFHQIASKFRRAKLRRSKDKELGSMSTVSMLCRQSLFVDIANVEKSKSCPTTPSSNYEDVRPSLGRKDQ